MLVMLVLVCCFIGVLSCCWVAGAAVGFPLLGAVVDAAFAPVCCCFFP